MIEKTDCGRGSREIHATGADVRANLPDSDLFLRKTVPSRPDVEIMELVDSGNDGHLFRGHSSTLRRDVACKIIPRSNLIHGPNGEETWRAEVHKADALRNPMVVKFEHICEWQDSASGIDCVVFVSEFVDGKCLRKFIATNPDEMTVAFIVSCLESMLNLLFEMQQRGIRHGDLHSGNILVEDRSSYDLAGPQFVFRVTDFGVADASSEQRFKDDFHQLADVLAQLLRTLDYARCSLKDKFIFNVLRNDFLGRHLVESDVTRDPFARRPRELFERLRGLGSEFEQTATSEPTNLLTPFDFLSCEQIGEASALLHALYSDRFLGLTEIESKNNVVVTGPRGCGKTTVFRSLSLEQRLRVEEASPRETHYLGVYFRCDDLHFTFPRYVLPKRNEGLDVPIHFATATLLSKLLDSLEGWAKRHFADQFAAAESSGARNLWDILGITPPSVPGADTIRAVVTRLNKERARAAEWQRWVNDAKRPIGPCFGPEVLLRACDVLAKAFLFVRERPVYFFIDDYSSPKVSKDLQASLNRMFFQRTSTSFFKLSTESPVSFVKSDIDGKSYVENREFILHNLGLVYLHADVQAKLTFIEDVFRRRLAKTPSFPAQELAHLVGTNVLNNNELALGIRRGEKPQLWGREALCHLCSGDIHYVISLVGDMVRLSGGAEGLAKTGESYKIIPATQNSAIRAAAGSFLKNLRGIPKSGDQLVDIVEAFGNVANSHLRCADSKNNDRNPPKQATRIEPYEPPRLSEDAQQLYDELLRYSVFIEDYRGKSRRGHVVPRLFLRRFLIPHFNLTFSTRDSIELESSDFEKFLLKPREFEKSHRLEAPPTPLFDMEPKEE
jgi:energy-coupling factor transporter ATP-binding protein EcfA2